MFAADEFLVVVEGWPRPGVDLPEPGSIQVGVDAAGAVEWMSTPREAA